MLTDEERNKFYVIFSQVEGGSITYMEKMVEEAIDDGIISQELFDDNETEVCGIFDSGWFVCDGCDWCLPMEDQDERGEWHCEQCMNERYSDED